MRKRISIRLTIFPAKNKIIRPADQIFIIIFNLNLPSSCIEIGFLFKGNMSGGFGCVCIFGDDKDESSETIIGPSLKERLPNESSAEMSLTSLKYSKIK